MDTHKNSFSRQIQLNTIANYIFKGLVLFLGFLYARYVLEYLGSGVYGMWVTATSITSWAGAFDLGIGNGLRNELTKAYANNNAQEQSDLISNAYGKMIKVSLFLMIFVSLVTEGLIGVGWLETELRNPMYINNAFFCLNLVLGLANSIAYSFQKSWIVSLFSFITQTFKVMYVCVLIRLSLSPNLVLFSFLNGASSAFCYVILIFILIKWLNIKIRFEIGSGAFLKDSIISLGLKFFILQIGSVVLYYTDNLIIKNIIGNDEVTSYHIINTIYDTGNNMLSILLISLWSAVTYSATKGDYHWIRKEERKMVGLWGCYVAGVTLVSFMLNWIVRIWLGDNAVQYDKRIIILFSVYTMLTGFEYIFVGITNGLGRLRIQMATSAFAAISNIPLSILFGKTMGLGIFGVKLATLVSLIPGIILIPTDVIRYVRKHDSAICMKS